MTAGGPLIREARANDVDGIVTVDRLHSGAAKPGYWARILEEYGAGAGGRVALVASGADDEILGLRISSSSCRTSSALRCPG